MRRRTKLTLEQHQQAAKLIAQINGGIRELLNHLDGRGATAYVLDRILKADSSIQAARARLDTIAATQLGREAEKAGYYGGSSDDWSRLRGRRRGRPHRG